MPKPIDRSPRCCCCCCICWTCEVAEVDDDVDGLEKPESNNSFIDVVEVVVDIGLDESMRLSTVCLEINLRKTAGDKGSTITMQ